MLRKLAGRLTWEPTDGGIRVVIPARRDLKPIGATILMLSWITLAWFATGNASAESNLLAFIWICLAAGAVALCVAVGWLMWSLTGRTELKLDPMGLNIRRRIAGVLSGTDSFPTQDVYDLRYIPPAYIWAFRTDTDPKTSGIQFCKAGKTYIIVRGITEREACALIDRMMEIHPFPKEPVLGLAGTA